MAEDSFWRWQDPSPIDAMLEGHELANPGLQKVLHIKGLCASQLRISICICRVGDGTKHELMANDYLCAMY